MCLGRHLLKSELRPPVGRSSNYDDIEFLGGECESPVTQLQDLTPTLPARVPAASSSRTLAQRPASATVPVLTWVQAYWRAFQLTYLVWVAVAVTTAQVLRSGVWADTIRARTSFVTCALRSPVLAQLAGPGANSAASLIQCADRRLA